VAVFFVSFGFGASRALADTAPDWLHAAARETMPPTTKDAVAVILLDEQITTVKDNGEIETTYRRAYKILRPEGRKMYGAVDIYFDKETRITSMKAWAIPADGKDYQVKQKDAVELGAYGDALYSDLRREVLEIPAANPGNVIGYEYSQKQRPFLFADIWDFQDIIPVRRARFTLQLPPGWQMATQWENYPALKETSTGNNAYSWELENIPAVETEPDMPPREAVAGRMGVKYFPLDPAARAKSIGTWNDIALWYAGLTASTRTPSPEIQQKVAELTANAATTLDKIKAIVSFMQRDIRYVAIEIGIGGYQPHPAADVFHFRYGDCKDKVTLLGSMLQVIGVKSYYVVAQTDRGIVQPDFPSPVAFDHMIIAIRLPDDVPSDGLWAIVEHPKYGRLLYFDPTDPYTPLGYIPSYEQRNYGLLVTPDGGELVPLPLSAPSTNRLLRTGQLKLTSTGDLTGDIQEVRWGGPAATERAWLLQTAPADRVKVIEEILGKQLANFRLTGATIGNLESYDQTLTLNYKFVAESYASDAGNLLLMRPRVLGNKRGIVDSDKPRKYPIEFPEATLQTDDFQITLPPGYVADDLPDAVDVKSEFASYKSKTEISGNSMHYQRTYQVTDILVPTEKLPSLRNFFSQIASDERATAVLRKSTP
jgi:hypothetical protein